MKNTWPPMSCGILLLIANASIVLTSVPASASTEGYFVVSARNTFSEDLPDVDDLRAVFLGEKLFWGDNERIIAVLPDFSHPATISFVQQVLGMDRQQYINYWRRKLFAGKGHPPKEFSTEQQALLLVRDNHGSVAILAAKPSEAKGLRVLQIDLQANRLVESTP